MGLNKRYQWAALVDRMVQWAVQKNDFSPLLGQYGGDRAPEVPPLLEWLRHMVESHESQIDTYGTELKTALQAALRDRSLKPPIQHKMGCPPDDRLWDLMHSLWGCPQMASYASEVPDLSPQRALELHLVRSYIGANGISAVTPRALQLPALLVNPKERVNQGRVVVMHLIRLSAADWPASPAFDHLHGCLVRAPGAYLLQLDREFQQAITRVEVLLARTLAPLPAGQPIQVLAWSLRPLPWPGEEDRFSLLELGGPSLGAWLALACLHLMADLLNPDVKRRWGGMLRELNLVSLSGTAALGDPPPPGADPLEWPLEVIGGATPKLIELNEFIQQNQTKRFSTQAVLLRQGQLVEGNQHPPLLDGVTLADWVRKAHAQSGHALGNRLGRLHDALLELPLADHSGRHQQFSLPPELLNQDFTPESPAPTGADAGPTALCAALKASLLLRYAHWAGGHYQPFGRCDGLPVLLSNHFHPIQIQPVPINEVDAQGRPKDDQANLPKMEEVNGLADLLAIDGVDRWLCIAAPAGGKTTLLAAFEMEAAHAALQRLNDTGRFGTIALWLPLRWCATSQVNDAPAAMAALWDLAIQSHPTWARTLRQAAVEGKWDAFNALGIQVVWLLDGINEMPAQSQSHRAQLIDWMDGMLTMLATASGGCIAQRVYTVRTHGRQGMLPLMHEAVLQPWDRKRRRDYMVLRLGAERPQVLNALEEAIENDPEPDHRKLMATPGHLATQITLLLSGLVSRPARHRAELFCTLLWVRLHQEVSRGHVDRALLSLAERTRLDNLQANLQREGGWRWSAKLEPRSLIASLARLAVSQQHLDPVARQRRQTGAADVWTMTATLDAFMHPPRLPQVELDMPGDTVRSTETLLRAAEQLNLIRCNPDGETLTWTHQLWLELFAALALSPEEDDGRAVWLDIQPVEPPPMELLWEAHQRKVARSKQLDSEEKIPSFLIPPVPESGDVEETLRYLVQLRGTRQVVDLVAKVTAQHPELAASLALDNWAAFGELRDHPQDGWRPEGITNPDGRVETSPELDKRRTHPVLNALRHALCQRMASRGVHISYRLLCGQKLSELGGDPRFEICGHALILKDEYWQPVGTPGGTVSVLMGDLEGRGASGRTREGKLLQVNDLPAFEMAGLLVTNAQMRCFMADGGVNDVRWWPGQAGEWRMKKINQDSRPWSVRPVSTLSECEPVACNFWWSLAYSLWESDQRQGLRAGKLAHLSGTVVRTALPVVVPTEAAWEAAARHGQPHNTQPRWLFGHTQGVWDDEADRFIDVLPWHFNHDHLMRFECSPVGVFVESAVGRLQDLAGNLWEWTTSKKTRHFQRNVETAIVDKRYPLTLRGGSVLNSALGCTVGYRLGTKPGNDKGFIGFRLMRERVLSS